MSDHSTLRLLRPEEVIQRWPDLSRLLDAAVREGKGEVTMALELEQTLYNADVVRYHRVGSLEVNGATVTATLDSFRNFDHRAMPVAPVISRKFPFSYSGEPGGAIAAAYVAIKQLPEWAGATDV